MERTLLLMRHAKSDWGDPSLEDIRRPLNERGRKDASFMGGFIQDIIGAPDQILSSDAIRARETADLVANGCQYKREIILKSSLYDSSPGKYLRAISEVPDEVTSLLVVGHNPIMEQLTSSLCSGRPNEIALRMSTAAIACFIIEDRNWRTLETGMCELKWFITPKILKNLSTE